MVRISEIQQFRNSLTSNRDDFINKPDLLYFWKLFQEISVPFATVSKFSKVLVEWKAPTANT